MRGLLLLCAAASLGCGGASPAPSAPSAGAPSAAAVQPGTPGATDVSGLQAAMAAGSVVLIDVRTPGEYGDGHVPGAVNIPISELEGRLSELEPHKAGALHLICASGGRSGRATDLLASKGWAQPINVEGGTRAWIAAGLPVE